MTQGTDKHIYISMTLLIIILIEHIHNLDFTIRDWLAVGLLWLLHVGWTNK